jgi:hypothetical protein
MILFKDLSMTGDRIHSRAQEAIQGRKSTGFGEGLVSSVCGLLASTKGWSSVVRLQGPAAQACCNC